MLEKLGDSVIKASGPKEALKRFKNKKDDINLLLTDFLMPEMNGYELQSRIDTIMPGIKTLFISGCSLDAMKDEMRIINKPVHFLQKPFSFKSLAGKVREVLEHK